MNAAVRILRAEDFAALSDEALTDRVIAEESGQEAANSFAEWYAATAALRALHEERARRVHLRAAA